MNAFMRHFLVQLCTLIVSASVSWSGCTKNPPLTIASSMPGQLDEQKDGPPPAAPVPTPAPMMPSKDMVQPQPDMKRNGPSEDSSGLKVVREAKDDQAPGLIINNGKIVFSPFAVKAGENEILAEGKHGGTIIMWEFTMIGGGPQDTLPELPHYITEKISWKEIISRGDPNFTLYYFNKLTRYLACRYSQAEAEEQLLKHVREWPFVAGADWETSQYSEKRFLRIASKAGDTKDYFTNWGNPKNLTDPEWLGFTKPKVWGPPNFKNLCDAVHGKGKTVEEALDKRLKGELEFFDEFMKNGGIYVRTYDPYYPSWWLRGNQIRNGDYQKLYEILSDTKDQSTRADRIYDVKSLGYPEIPRDEQELKAIDELIRFFDTDPQVRDWFAQRAEAK